jgi:hypothetical protein
MVDRYTKAVLTVIAGCLLWQCAMSLGRPVEAQRLAAAPPHMLPGQAQPVVIVGWGEMSPKGEVMLSLKRQADGTQVTDPALPVRLPYSPGSPLPVSVESPIKLAYTREAPLAVGVTAIKRTADWDSIDTNVLPGPRTTRPGELQD